jgi:hypothetical protein
MKDVPTLEGVELCRQDHFSAASVVSQQRRAVDVVGDVIGLERFLKKTD